MIGAGTIINPILKVVTTVAILAAVYLFIVKPTLDTTEEISRQTGPASILGGGDGGFDELEHQRSQAEHFMNSLGSSWPQARREVRGCVKEARGEERAMERCAELGRTLVTQVNSNRTFARSYAQSLSLQGRSGDAERVYGCVEKAGFKAGPMQRCRNLADRLLFGL